MLDIGFRLTILAVGVVRMSNEMRKFVFISGAVLIGVSSLLLLRKSASAKTKSKDKSSKETERNTNIAEPIPSNVAETTVTEQPQPEVVVQPPVPSNLKAARMFVNIGSNGTALNFGRIPFDAFSANTRGEQASTPYFIEMSSRYAPQDFMSSQDYYNLVNQGYIPQNFNPAQIVSTTSHNGAYKYMVGYSNPYQTKAAKDSFNVISPLWAVVFDVNPSVSHDGPLTIPNVSRAELDDALQRALFAEWMLTRAGFGCSAGSTLEACNAERAAIANAVIQRALDKYSMYPSSNPISAVFRGPGQKWNGSDAFLSAYNGYAGRKGFKDSAKIALPSSAVNNFNMFYSNFWHMPKLSLIASSFIHPKSLSIATPSWAKVGDPKSDNINYASLKPIKLGEAVFIDSRKTFR